MSTRHRNNDVYRGAPTKIGRSILFFFGLPFVLGGVVMLGGAFLGDVREWLALLLGGTAFLVIGLMVWIPALPQVINRLRQSEHPASEWIVRNAGRIGFTLLLLIMCGTPMLMAVGIIPTEESDWPAPRWVAVAAGSVFLLGGLYVLLQKRIQQLEPGLRKQVTGLFPLLIVTGMAVIADWVAFGPGERAFSASGFNGIFGITMGGDELIGRIVFGVSGVFLSVITLIGWWKYLHRDW